MRLLIVLLLLFLQNTASAFTFAPTTNVLEATFLPVEQAFRLSVDAPKDGKINASWQISDGYYLYRKQLSLSGPQADNLHFAPFPNGDTKTDPYFGHVVIYKHNLSLPIYYDTSLPAGTVINATLHYQGCADKGLCYAPQETPIVFTVPKMTQALQSSPKETTSTRSTTHKAPNVSEASSVSETLTFSSPWIAVISLFGMGLLLSFTPCVLPMVPIVSAIVIGSRQSKLKAFYLSFVYVLAMAFTYGAIGAIAGTFGRQINLQATLQSPIVLSVSALIFVVLSLAMFGIYELRLPSSWQNRLQQNNQANTSSTLRHSLQVFLAGVFATLIVSPCVSAPVAGVLIYISSQGNTWYGALMLFVMGFGMGIPLLMVGVFGPRVLPKNGPWLHDTKIIMGFALLAVSIWLVTRWLPLQTHLFLWGTLSLAISGYFFHKTTTLHSHPIRWFFALLFGLIGAFELFGGISGATNPLQPLDASYVSSTTTKASPYAQTVQSLEEISQLVSSDDKRPIVLDVYADWCVSCQVFEQKVLRSSNFAPYIEKIRLVKVDVTSNSPKNQALMQHFELFGPPSFVFLDDNGNEQKALTLQGEPSEKDFIERIKFVTERKQDKR